MRVMIQTQARSLRLFQQIKQVHRDRKGQRVLLAPQDQLGARGLLVLLVAQVLLALLVLQALLVRLAQRVQLVLQDHKV